MPVPSVSAADVRAGVRVKTSGLPSITLPTANPPAQAAGRLVPSLILGLPVLAPAPALVPAASPVQAQSQISAAAQPPASQPVGKLAEAVQAEAASLQTPSLGAEGSSAVGQRVEDLMTGGRSASGADSPVAAAAAAAPAPTLRASAAQAASAQPVPAVQSAVRTAPATDSSVMYGAKRRFLAAVASAFGIVASLPPAGPALAQKVLDEAASKRVAFSDFDDTLGPYNSVLTPEMAAAIAAVRRSGKEVAVITDRTDASGGHQLSAFESLAAIPAADRAGMYVAAVSGGKVYRYDAQGEPVKVWEYPPFDDSRRQPVLAAIAAVKDQLAALGTSQHPGDAKNPAESWQAYSYAMMLAAGTPADVVKKAGRIFESELNKRGMEVKVNARVPKDPANPAYIQFSIVNKSASVKYISNALGIAPREALALGDNMYVPLSPERPSRLAQKAWRWAERVSGRAIPQIGNETDRNMEKALPGMLALSVGGTADPRMANAYVLPGHGAPVSLQVLRAMASRPAGAKDPGAMAVILPALAILGAAALGYLAMFKAFADVFSQP
ncbi:MAG: hypothetical protein WC881_08380 [Elusimicrobiota bacterium]